MARGATRAVPPAKRIEKAHTDDKSMYGMTVEERMEAASTATVDAGSSGSTTVLVTMLVVFVATGAAFIPSTMTWLDTGVWHMNVIYKYTNPFQRLVNIHAISGLAMLVLFAVQVTTGVTAKVGPTRRKFHRLVGLFLITPLLLLTVGIASATEIAANLCCQEFGFHTTLITAVIGTTFLLGLRAAFQKRIDDHKDWMMWAVLLTTEVGLARLGMFAAQPYYQCDTFLSDWPFVVSTWLTNIAAFVCLRAVGRFGIKHKANLFLWLLQASVGTYAIYGAIMFECPEDRIMILGANVSSTNASLH